MVLNAQLDAEAYERQNQLGKALIRQLAELAQVPMTQRDTISLQVILDKLVSATPQVARATAFDTADELVAQSQTRLPPGQATVSFNQPVALNRTPAGTVRLELFDATTTPFWRTPLLGAMSTWLLTSLLYLFWRRRSSLDIANRLATVNHGLLPSPNENGHLDELELLEVRIQPLISRAVTESLDESGQYTCILAICCHNLPRLKVQLSAEHFEALFSQLDAVVDQACRLYEGKRLTANRNCLLLEFRSAAANGDHSLRALYFARAMMMICQEWAPSRGIPLELSMVLDDMIVPTTDSSWIRELAIEQAVASITAFTEIAVPWEILLRRRLMDNATFGACVEADPVSDKHPLSRFKKLGEAQSAILMRQIAFLQNQIPLHF